MATFKDLGYNALKQLGVMGDYCKKFKQSSLVTMFEGGIGYYIGGINSGEEYDWLLKKIEDINNGGERCVYGVIHSISNIGETYEFLVMTSEDLERDINNPLDNCGGGYEAFAYVVNKDYNEEEYGYIGVKGRWGGIIRIW